MSRLDWISTALEALRREGVVVLVTQCVVEGSAPREAGAKMLVMKDTFWGTIGGGNLEHHVLEQARSLLSRPDLMHLLQDYPLGPLLSQCCGGHVRVLLERFTDADACWLAALGQQVQETGGLILESRLKGEGARKCTRGSAKSGLTERAPFADEFGEPLPHSRPPRDQCAFYREFIALPLSPVYTFGAGHVGRALMKVLSVSDFPLHWYDARPEYEGGAGPVPVRLLASLGEAVAALPPSAICIIVTHAHELDYQLTRAILARGDFLYCGLIGSKSKRARFLRRLASDNIPKAAVGRLTCPIGLPEIEGKTPFAVALSIAAEINNIAAQDAGAVVASALAALE